MKSPLAMIAALSTRMICLALAAGILALHFLLAQQPSPMGYALELWFLACALALFLRKKQKRILSGPDTETRLADDFSACLPDLIWCISFANRSVNPLNHSFADIHPQATAENKKISSLFPARISRQYLEALISVQSTQKPQTFEYQYGGNDQLKRYFEARLLPQSSRDCMAVIRDITHIKDTEQALLNQQLFVHQIIDSSPNLIFVRDKHGRFLLVNHATQTQLGHELLVQSHMGLVDSPQPFTLGDADVLEKGETIRHLDSWLMPDNQVHWFDITKLPIVRDENTYILSIAMDISHLKSTEAAMEDIQSLIRNVADALPVRFVLIEQGVITFANQGAEALLGQTNKELTGKTLTSLIDPNGDSSNYQIIELTNMANQLVIFK
ncbi:PAS domain-containing protein [Iodobacter fluviatilis]|uniref:PAS domain S-box-containing protein n=1 Tax=Iodobacter fluviatilis TaxID=537 RepID=A0A377Q7H1_9NEIS|nr:PAS domain-containing protein [Iodobacter fluviatilis]TCU82713.1 PAS domain S-box-containing protein [Iodobacter fluviatilis]STQ89801.1 Predicted integral membrane sensor domain [Iodobacter fluviatilis]